MPAPRYRLRLAQSVKKDIRFLMQSDRQRIRAAIQSLADDPRPGGCQKLVSQDGYRVRVGIFRITYAIDDKAREVTIYRVLHRKDVYRT